ncbi:MAG: hypothetical protein H6757_05845 [Candidatus Omnitrophica bacterium]|nr:hypothetical protein [Candidatus Omnitrophota bacterium]
MKQILGFILVLVLLGAAHLSAEEIAVVVMPDQVPEAAMHSNLQKGSEYQAAETGAKVDVTRKVTEELREEVSDRLDVLDAKAVKHRLDEIDREIDRIERENRIRDERLRYLDRSIDDLKRRR